MASAGLAIVAAHHSTAGGWVWKEMVAQAAPANGRFRGVLLGRPARDRAKCGGTTAGGRKRCPAINVRLDAFFERTGSFGAGFRRPRATAPRRPLDSRRKRGSAGRARLREAITICLSMC